MLQRRENYFEKPFQQGRPQWLFRCDPSHPWSSLLSFSYGNRGLNDLFPLTVRFLFPIMSPISSLFLLYRYVIVSGIRKKWVLYPFKWERKYHSAMQRIKSERKSDGQWKQAVTSSSVVRFYIPQCNELLFIRTCMLVLMVYVQTTNS